MKHQRKSQRPEGMSRKTIRKMAAAARKEAKKNGNHLGGSETASVS